VASKDLGDTKLLIEGADNQVKVEVNAVFRGGKRAAESAEK